MADVAFVNAHAKGDGGDDAVDLARHELALHGFALRVQHAGVVGLRGHAVLAEVAGYILGRFLQGDIHNAALLRARGQPLGQALQLVGATDGLDQQIQVGAVKAGAHHVKSVDGKFGLHIGHDGRGSGGGQQKSLRNFELALVIGQFLVIGAKVVTPLRDAMRLVHHQERDGNLRDEVAKTLVFEPFY